MKWEYKVERITECSYQNDLNNLGEQEWELMLCINGRAIFKRPKPADFYAQTRHEYCGHHKKWDECNERHDA